MRPTKGVPGMNWGEFKKLVEEAGVRDDHEVDDLGIIANTDGCDCPLSTRGKHPDTICWEPEKHFVRELTIGGREVFFTWADPPELCGSGRQHLGQEVARQHPGGDCHPPGISRKEIAMEFDALAEMHLLLREHGWKPEDLMDAFSVNA